MVRRKGARTIQLGSSQRWKRDDLWPDTGTSGWICLEGPFLPLENVPSSWMSLYNTKVALENKNHSAVIHAALNSPIHRYANLCLKLLPLSGGLSQSGCCIQCMDAELTPLKRHEFNVVKDK